MKKIYFLKTEDGIVFTKPQTEPLTFNTKKEAALFISDFKIDAKILATNYENYLNYQLNVRRDVFKKHLEEIIAKLSKWIEENLI